MRSFIFLPFFFFQALSYPSLQDAEICSSSKCLIENDCRCASTQNPISPIANAPQLIAITVSESVVKVFYDNYWKPLLFDRKNPDGNPIGASFYVNHEYTDYTLVHDLYLRGFEIGVHSITKNSSQEYWRHATLDDLVEEFSGQRQIISHFANISIDDIIGARTPQLQLEGDLSIDAYVQSGISYDNSWPGHNFPATFPYTLDYLSNQECLVTPTCPKEPHPHFWIAPIVNIKGLDGVECNSLAACLVTGSADEIASWLVGQVDDLSKRNRPPLVLRLDSYWFLSTNNSYQGFSLFLDEMAKRNDVFFVSVGDIIQWVKNPVPTENYKTPVHERQGTCNPRNCKLDFNGNVRYMNQCVGCPDVYPWKGNPMGEIKK